MSRCIMIQGSMSNVGKSLLTAGLCRIFMQDGFRVAPFKSQNMALNSYITNEGLEIGRAQAMQCEAAGIEPSAYMNPLLLKPTGDMGSQVIVMGKPIGNMKAADYFKYKNQLRPTIKAAFDHLSSQVDIVVIEGAGSPAEINLKQNDIVNMGMAKMADAPVLLVGDIDRGGVFAQLYGTIMLLTDEERERVAGLIINKFRGDAELLKPGIVELSKLCNKDILGVVPYFDIDVEDEDSLAERMQFNKAVGNVDIAVIRLPRISNFTDFNPLETIEGVVVRYVKNTIDLGNPDIIFLPGSKSTIDDLKWLKQTGLFDEIKNYAQSGKPVMGICGGFQMMGNIIIDDEGAENKGSEEGLALLPITTYYNTKKTTNQISGKFLDVSGIFNSLSGLSFSGYEIHMGQTVSSNQLTNISSSGNEGCQNGNCYGTYVHGIFDDAKVSAALITSLLSAKGINCDVTAKDYTKYKNEQYDKLANGLRQSLDIAKIYEIMNIKI